MNRIVECIPNFSEGRRNDIVEKIIAEIGSVRGVRVLDRKMDADHNRTVVTYIGEPDAVVEAAFSAIAKAAELIDMDSHRGSHPRIGATDVVPFVPVRDVSMAECVQLANHLGKNVADKLGIPVYLYEAAARSESRRNLADIRKGQYEGLKIAIRTDPSRKPDYGPSRLHPRAGAVVIGARLPLIAYNVNLDTDDLALAKDIAKKVRFKDGGFKHVKAIGLELKDRNIVQISMNLTDYRETPMQVVYERIAELAAEHGVRILESEIIGLIPNDAMLETARHYLKLSSFERRQVLENNLEYQ